MKPNPAKAAKQYDVVSRIGLGDASVECTVLERTAEHRIETGVEIAVYTVVVAAVVNAGGLSLEFLVLELELRSVYRFLFQDFVFVYEEGDFHRAADDLPRRSS